MIPKHYFWLQLSRIPALVAVLASFNSCTAAIFCLPEPKTPAEKLRNDLSPLAIPVAVPLDIAVIIPAFLVYGVAKTAVCGVNAPAETETDTAALKPTTSPPKDPDR